MLSAIALILAFQVVGEVISRSAGIPVPGPVIGMILMLLAFFVKDDLIGRIRPTGGVLLSNLSLLFVPAGVGVMRYGDLFLREGLSIRRQRQMCIRDSFLREGLAIGAVLVISTLIAMLVTAYTIIFVDKLVHKNKNKD